MGSSPPSPSKFPMSPGMPVFAMSPERAAGVNPLYRDSTPQSPSLPDLRTSPLRRHRRNDSDISVHGLAAMFENLEVKDFKEAQAKYTQAMQNQKTKHAAEVRQMEKDYALAMSRRQVRIEELQAQLNSMAEIHQGCIPKDVWDAARKEQRDAISKWEGAMKRMEEKRGQMEGHIDKLNRTVEAYKAKCHTYKQSFEDARDRKDKLEKLLPNYQGKVSGLERTIKRSESDLKFHMGEAEKYKNQVYGLQVEAESVREQLGEEVDTLKDKLRLVEAERDALKMSLKEEEVMRIAAEGQIPLPTTTTDEHDEFGSPVRTPRKQRTPEHDDEDKENVAPKKAVVELRLAQQELLTERRLRERAQDQIDFMKMECQFRCCSCRIADSQGSQYTHDGSYASEMERIKSSVPVLTPPPSNHGDNQMERVEIKQEPIDDGRLPSPPIEDSEHTEQTLDHTATSKRSDSETPEPVLAFSPTSGTFRSMPSPSKDLTPIETVTPVEAATQALSAITEIKRESSPWAPDAHSTIIPISRPQSRASVLKQPGTKASTIEIHEDAVMDSDEEDTCPQTPLHGPTGPATPGQYLTRTITTTTTIPLHFSPATPAMKRGAQATMTPSTVAHATNDARTPILGELSLNRVPFDREAALEAIRERRGRARSMAAGQGTPRKQMMEGVKERRDISAPVSRMALFWSTRLPYGFR
ncbi:hypothetical protein CC80DRAFT_483382 [Byssothecium circinans]|uniref:Uncharacterized protein n=1 Tax=Byssothecium circinans TaxID=147558 RepID=A0A6A5TEC4_9PLEO|nr:hypothetical protein CC80DRAFT_483382 [Byssothecium circinans]